MVFTVHIYIYIVTVSFIGGGNRSTRRLATSPVQTSSHDVLSSTPRHERISFWLMNNI
jgi:hypothetical protein